MAVVAVVAGNPPKALVLGIIFVVLTAGTGAAIVLRLGNVLPTPTPVPVAFDRLALDRSASLPVRHSWVVQDQASWDALWAAAGSTPPNTVPPVDYTASTVLVVAMGTRPTAGHTIQVAAVYRVGSQVFVELTETSPGATCVVAQVATAPFDVVRIPKTTDGVTFTSRTVIGAC